jgi:hypothetical protein
MTKTIWKSVLRTTDSQQIMIPDGSEMLCAREQNEEICVWYRCDPYAMLAPRDIAVIGTGNPSPGDDWRYIGTASLLGGRLMFHVFELATVAS